MVDRDYTADMTKIIDDFIPDGDYVASEQADRLVDHLLLQDPDLLRGWLETCAVVLLTQHISHRRRSRVRFAVAQTTRSAFADAAAKYERHLEEQEAGVAPGTFGGDPEPLSVFAEHLVINGDKLARPIGQMTKADHLYVAGQHGNRAKNALLEQAFYEAVAGRIPEGGVTSDVFTEDQFLELRNSIAAL